MRKSIIILESQMRLIEEYNNELTYYKFYTEVLDFLRVLMKSPNEAQTSKILQDHGITRPKLIKTLTDRGVLRCKRKIDEIPQDGSDKKEAKLSVKYDVLKKDFEKKLHRAHIELCECVKPEVRQVSLEEEGLGGAMSCGMALQGGGNSFESGEYVNPIGQVQRRTIYNPRTKKKKSKK